jgi:hypothetical protein
MRTEPSQVLPPPSRPNIDPAPLPHRPTLLPLSFVLALVALVGFGSVAVTLTASYFLFAHAAAAQAAVPATPADALPAAAAPAQPAAAKEQAPPPPADTLAVLPFEMQFEPTPAFRHEVEKLNAALPQLLADGGKLRVKSLAQTGPLKYSRDPVAAARELNVRAVLLVKFMTDAAADESACRLELIDSATGFLLWGTEVEAPGGFMKHPERLELVRRQILDQVPKRMALQQ